MFDDIYTFIHFLPGKQNNVGDTWAKLTKGLSPVVIFQQEEADSDWTNVKCVFYTVEKWQTIKSNNLTMGLMT